MNTISYKFDDDDNNNNNNKLCNKSMNGIVDQMQKTLKIYTNLDTLMHLVQSCLTN